LYTGNLGRCGPVQDTVETRVGFGNELPPVDAGTSLPEGK